MLGRYKKKKKKHYIVRQFNNFITEKFSEKKHFWDFSKNNWLPIEKQKLILFDKKNAQIKKKCKLLISVFIYSIIEKIILKPA